ncbi:GNAT family N-acetyltransferase [Kribbella antiqua]|uniref:GNAT family N-acetyltransferase n=1 Tax=Kribbella antiqua TaxID=2512217 RepID=UPI00104C99A9|nr:GNAT family N-acetyltransferase [Kribbella antiqua]
MNIRLTPLTDPDYRPFSRRLAWLAADADGNPVGSAFLRLNSRPTQAHLAELELNVHPAERRRGIGSRLLDAVVGAAREHDVRTLLADVRVDSPGDHFLHHHGFAIGLSLVFARHRLADVVLDSVVGPEGYRLESWVGVVPDELAQTFTDARAGMDDAPQGDIAYGEDVWDVERTRNAAQVIEQRGEVLCTVAAVHEASGAIAGFTELVVPGDGKGDAQHYGTAVLPAHRRRGLALWMKSEQIRQTRQRFPDLDGLLTDTVDTNAPMQRVNAHLGYQPTHRLNRRTLDLQQPS